MKFLFNGRVSLNKNDSLLNTTNREEYVQPYVREVRRQRLMTPSGQRLADSTVIVYHQDC